MKKFWLRTLAAALILCLAMMGAVAESGSIMPQRGTNDTYLRVSDVAVVGEDAYFLAYSRGYMVLWRWRAGMEQAEEVGHNLLRGDNLNQGQEFPEADVEMKYAVSVLASDGEQLLSVNPATGLVFSLTVDEDGVTCRDIVTLADTDVFYRHSKSGDWYAGATAVAVSGGYLYWLGSGWDEAAQSNRERIVRYSLADGSAVEVAVSGAASICAYGDGKLCILARPQSGSDGTQPYTVSLYDPAEGSVTPVGEIDTTRVLGSIIYAPALDSLLWQEGTNIMGMQGLGEEQLYAYVPTSVGGDMAVIGDTLILSLSGKTVVRTLVPGLTAPESLQVMNTSFDNAATSFSEQYPDVPLEIINESDVEGYEPWLNPSGDANRVDVLRLYTTDGGDLEFTTLRDAGLLMDLSADPEVVAYVETLYPPFRELVTGENGEIWAVPTQTVSYTGFFVNRKAMQDMGLTEADMPTNLVELCEFITMWDREYADRFPNYCCIEYSENTKQYLTDMAINMWIGHCQATGQEIRFDAPEFRRVMEAISGVSTVRTDVGMRVTNPEISDYKTGLFWIDCQLVGNWAAYMEDYSDRIFIPLTLTEDTPYHAAVGGVELWVVNRSTESAEYAVKYIREQIADVNDKYAHVLLTNRTEPVESPYYAESLAYAQRQLGEMQMELLQASTAEEEEAIRRRITEQEAYMATELRRTQYEVTPSAIDNYVNVLAPAMYIQRWNPLQHTSEGVNSVTYIRDRWLNGTIDTEQFIRELDARMLMLEMAQP